MLLNLKEKKKIRSTGLKRQAWELKEIGLRKTREFVQKHGCREAVRRDTTEGGWLAKLHKEMRKQAEGTFVILIRNK